MKRIILALFVLLLALAVTNCLAQSTDKDKTVSGKNCCAQGAKVSMNSDAQSKTTCMKDGKACDPKTCTMKSAMTSSGKSGKTAGQCPMMKTASAKGTCKAGSNCPMSGKASTKKNTTDKTSDTKGTN